ncbi:oxidoreductase [Amycolatopsis antarctica]|uniref:Oxidoreductase n=1 Tax=Amycolatopsis antarctica TaxID=1854586 RepID=A0A263D7F3_9PSEU|nr:PDR/VanB family oxidoreductase [Amycolatopsis antarctica]OZM74454.1 oxidoreductase [Amycolatopsis antarctica]
MTPTAPGGFRPGPVLRAVGGFSAAYRRLFAASRVAPLLSRPNPVRYEGFDLDLVIRGTRRVADEVLALTLNAADGGELPTWVPGAHVDVFLPSGRQRQYSLCGDPADRSVYRIAVRQIGDGLGGSREIHEELRVGDRLTARGPRNAFRLVEADSYLFVAGGIGITPILPMVRACHRRGVPWRLVYLGRSRDDMPFLDELAGFGSGVTRIRPDDEYGPPDLGAVLPATAPGAAVYLCGPPPLMAAARAVARKTAGSLHAERFSAPPVREGTPFEIRLRRSGRTVFVGPDESALTAIRREVPGLAYSCRQGFCRTCEVRVLEGSVEHRDTALPTSARADAMLVCVSRSAGGPLTIDL